ncbi:MAG TPA: VOC family protein [Caulobacteraceae bacterium]|jgi:catechol 2,3-dioxygenase-like lactoylglutathione lyase family enzyme
MVKLDHLGYAVRDWRTSRDWYVDNLGFRVEFEIAEGGASGQGAVALQDDAGLTVFLNQTDGPIQSGQAGCTLQVDDVEALHAALSSRGVAFRTPPSKQYWGYGAVLADPDGHLLYLYDEASMAAKGGG